VTAIIDSTNAVVVRPSGIATSVARGADDGKCAGERHRKWIRRRFHGTLVAA
jgi:hypothetical protein